MKRHTKKNDFAALLKNKNVLYIVLFFAVANLFSYLMLKKLDAVAFFIIIGFLTTYFSKNMIIVMLTAMISTFLLVQINILGHVQEGMTGQPPVTPPTGGAVAEKKEDAASGAGASGAAPAAAAPAPAVAAPADAVVAGAINGADRAKITATSGSTMKAPEKFTQQLSPARYNSADDDDVPRHKPKVDYAGTLESAYDNLDKLLSSDAIRSMSEDTSRLAEKQKQLMGNIEKIQPVMDKAKGILDGIDMGTISKLMGSIGGSLGSMKGAKPADQEAVTTITGK
jgi:hypothetical protein